MTFSGGGIKTLHSCAKALWSLTSKYLVVIESGDIDGFSRIQRFRDMFIPGRKAAHYRKNVAVQDEKTHGEMDEDDKFEADGAIIPGARIIAPCLHQKECPLENLDLSCTFAQQYHIPEFNRETMGRTNPDGRAWFSYIILEKESVGENPPHPPILDEFYGRVIRPPLKRGGHVHVDVCSMLGTLERISVGKSYGSPYRVARKTRLGDLFPLGPERIPKSETKAEKEVPTDNVTEVATAEDTTEDESVV